MPEVTSGWQVVSSFSDQPYLTFCMTYYRDKDITDPFITDFFKISWHSIYKKAQSNCRAIKLRGLHYLMLQIRPRKSVCDNTFPAWNIYELHIIALQSLKMFKSRGNNVEVIFRQANQWFMVSLDYNFGL